MFARSTSECHRSHSPFKPTALAFAAATLALGSQAVNANSTESTLATVEVIGSEENLIKLPGSANIISQTDLDNSRAFTVNEVLRKVPGVTVRDEEGFGLRPNIAIRGLNPTRSTKC